MDCVHKTCSSLHGAVEGVQESGWIFFEKSTVFTYFLISDGTYSVCARISLACGGEPIIFSKIGVIEIENLFTLVLHTKKTFKPNS